MTDPSRREFLGSVGLLAAGVALRPQLRVDLVERLADSLGDDIAHGSGAPDDEAFWARVRTGFDMAPDVINLDHGWTAVPPRTALAELSRKTAWVEQVPAMRLERTFNEITRAKVQPAVAKILGVPPAEIALQRNATEALDTVLMGFPMRAGDELVCCTQDYPQMLFAIQQRAAREGIVVKMVTPPAPAPSMDALVQAYTAAFTERTKLVLVTHPSNNTGQLMPVRRIADAAHRLGAKVLVDGAQSLGLLEYTMADLGCDFFGASLHKWLMTPTGSGVLWITPELESVVWPLIPPYDNTGMKRFEEFGTAPDYVWASALPALTLHETLGAARKGARLRYLATYWRTKAERLPGIRFYTIPGDEMSCGMVTFALGERSADTIGQAVGERHHILTQPKWCPAAPDVHGHGVRITPTVWTSVRELNTFVGALKEIAG